MSNLRQRWANRRRLPLRVTLVASMLALVTAALVVIGVAGSTLLQRYLLNRVDTQLRTTATNVLRQSGSTLDGAGASPLAAFYLSLTDSAGNLLEGGLFARRGDTPPPGPKLPMVTSTYAQVHSQSAFTVRATQGGRHWRVYILALPSGQSVTAALPLDDVNSTVNRLIWIDAVVSAIVLAALAGVGYFLVRGSLRRLTEVERTAEAIAAGDLSR